jgi:hypothetical protein
VHLGLAELFIAFVVPNYLIIRETVRLKKSPGIPSWSLKLGSGVLSGDRWFGAGCMGAYCGEGTTPQPERGTNGGGLWEGHGCKSGLHGSKVVKKP